MKRVQLVTKIAIYLLMLLALILVACQETEPITNMDDGSEIQYTIEEVGDVIQLQYIERLGMKYMVSSGQYYESGTAICNLTLDSLKVEFYKRQLSE